MVLFKPDSNRHRHSSSTCALAAAQQGHMADDFYLRYYVGHKGKFGHEFLEFEFNKDGRVRRASGPLADKQQLQHAAMGQAAGLKLPQTLHPLRSCGMPTTPTTKMTRSSRARCVMIPGGGWLRAGTGLALQATAVCAQAPSVRLYALKGLWNPQCGPGARRGGCLNGQHGTPCRYRAWLCTCICRCTSTKPSLMSSSGS